jgi:trimethylamine--corrinoid protein Co-methyltransferase
MLRFCSKHGNHELHRAEQAPFLIAALTALCGSKEAVCKEKIASVVYCPVSPLVHDGPMCDAYLDLGDYDVPVLVLPMPATGTTGPASLFSSIVQGNAEALSSIVIFQIGHPGRPIIFGSASGSLDFTSGNFLAGAPEMVLQTAAMSVMGRFYNLPNTATGCVTDAKQPGPQAVLEKVITTLPAVLMGADLISGMGEIESDQNLVLEQVLVDNEIAHLCERLYQGVDSSVEKDLFDDIVKVGPGGNFLKARSTRSLAHSSEFYMPKLLDRHMFETWVGLGRPDMYELAREKVREILEAPVVDPLTEKLDQEIDEILSEADRALKEDE